MKLGQSGPGYSSALGVGPPNSAMDRRYISPSSPPPRRTCFNRCLFVC